MEEIQEGEYEQVLDGTKSLNEVFGSLMLARIHFPEISEDLAKFKQLSERRGEITQDIEELQQEKETLDEEITDTAETIREHIYNV